MNESKEQSVKDRIKKIAKQQGRTFEEVWQEAILERYLARLANSPYRKNFIFKGAMCLLQYMNLQRKTRDLDFLLKDLQGGLENIKNYLSKVSAISLDDGFIFDKLDVQLLNHTHMQYPGYTVSMIAHLGKTRTKIFIDIGVGDDVKATEITMHLLSTDKAPLFEKEIELWAYPIESIFAEKLQTAITRGPSNSRMKDYHDLINLIRSNTTDIKKLQTALVTTFKNRGSKLGIIEIDDRNLAKIQTFWTIYFNSITDEIKHDLDISLKKIISEINNFLITKKLIDPS